MDNKIQDLNNKQFDRENLEVVIRIFIILLIVVHGLFNSYIKVDSITVFLLIILLIFPYISKIKYLKFKDLEVKFFDREQSTSYPVSPQIQIDGKTPIVSIEDFSPMEKKILSTLYKYQKQSFQDDITKRWTFAITPLFKGYPEYLEGVSKLLKKELIAVSPENNHCMFTNDGLDYVNKHKKEIYDEKIAFGF